jgi:hypothetical protein
MLQSIKLFVLCFLSLAAVHAQSLHFLRTDLPSSLNPSLIVSADFNGDTFADIAVLDVTTRTVSIRFGNGDGTFQAPVSTGILADSIAVGDFNNDTKPDLVVGNVLDGKMYIYTNSGTGSFAITGTLFINFPPNNLAVGRVNADNNLDVVITSSVTPSLAV